MSGAWLHVFRSDELILQGRYLDCTYSYFFYLMQSNLVEGTFPDGTKLITVHDPVSCENGNLEMALHGSFLPVPSLEKFPVIESCKIPGEQSSDMVGSHYHFIEVNPSLIFDRRKAYRMRLNIPAGTARFEPGDTKSVTLVKIGGMQVIRGGNAIAVSPGNDSNVRTVMESVNARGFGNSEDTSTNNGIILEGSPFAYNIPREALGLRQYARSNNWRQIIRDGMGQASGYSPSNCLDTVITNAWK
ncbi:hypothetical protein L2E82_33563 [Cichorium intybus]|uniref:Uncharacterized protein n=1 Tax=Cichorium intybus TaxID=13427 RepID=A0ACB9BKG9_CICIN|nr:hypothetical protein L2E82_33563 [Cichorium intybus]